jgi:hypothetical protein
LPKKCRFADNDVEGATRTRLTVDKETGLLPQSFLGTKVAKVAADFADADFTPPLLPQMEGLPFVVKLAALLVTDAHLDKGRRNWQAFLRGRLALLLILPWVLHWHLFSGSRCN